MIGKLFKAGADVFRINMSHTSQDRMRELVAMIRGVETRHRPADRHPGRSAGAEAAARHLCRRLGDGGKRRQLRARQRPGARRRHARLSAASGNFRRGRARAHAADRRRQGAAHRHRRPSPSAWSRASRSPANCPTARASACRIRPFRSPPWPRRTAPISKPRSTPASTGWRCRSSSGRRTSRRPRRSRAAAPR